MKKRLLLLISCCSLLLSCGKEGPKPAASKPEPAPIKVLVRELLTGSKAIDGAYFSDRLEIAARESAPERRKALALVSEPGMQVERESCVVQDVPPAKVPEGACKKEWKADPSQFDFLVRWNRDSKEHTKFSESDPVRLSVKESWQVTKPRDPNVAHTWQASYQVVGPGFEGFDFIDSPKWKPAVEKQLDAVVAPARGPILKELHAFLETNQSAAAR